MTERDYDNPNRSGWCNYERYTMEDHGSDIIVLFQKFYNTLTVCTDRETKRDSFSTNCFRFSILRANISNFQKWKQKLLS